MAPVLNVDPSLLVDLRADVAVPHGHRGKGTKHVKVCNGLGGRLDPAGLCGNPVLDLEKEVIFQAFQLLIRAENVRGKFFETLRRIALSRCQGLLSEEIIRHLGFEGIGHLNAVAEVFIVFDLKRPDAGLLPFLVFEVQKPAPSLCLGGTQPVDVFIVAA